MSPPVGGASARDRVSLILPGVLSLVPTGSVFAPSGQEVGVAGLDGFGVLLIAAGSVLVLRGAGSLGGGQ